LAESEAVEIGRLRWPVYLATRQQAAQVAGTGIDETFRDLQRVMADVQPVGALTFWGVADSAGGPAGGNGGLMQTDAPFTHRIFVRWLDSLDQTQVVFRATQRRDGSTRTERFRVRRIKELGGRKRFVLIEAQLEELET